MAKRKTSNPGGELLPGLETHAQQPGHDLGQAPSVPKAEYEVHPARSKQGRPWEGDNYHISQSTYKAYLKYEQGSECGISFIEQYILRNPLFANDEDETQAQYLGKYFEYKATNYHDGTPPQPLVYKVNGGEKYSKGDPKPEFKLADLHANIFLDVLDNMGLQIIEAGRYMRSAEHKISLLLDVVVHLPEESMALWDTLIGSFFTSKGQKVKLADQPSWHDCKWTTAGGIAYDGGCFIIDMKMSSLMNDKWHEMGWHPDFVDQRPHHGIQAYTYEGVTGLPFFFYVASSKEVDVRFIRSLVDERAMKQHLQSMEKARKQIIRAMTFGGYFLPRPSLGRCSQCPLKEECQYRTKAPLWTAVTFQINQT